MRIPLVLAPCLFVLPLGLAPALAQETRFTDLTGEEIVLDGPAKKIVSIVAPTASTVISIDGSTETLVGVNPVSINTFRSGAISQIYPDAIALNSNIVQSGGGTFAPNVEAIAALSPDIVIQAGFAGHDIVAPLNQVGINTALYMWGTEEQARQVNTMIGAILAKPERAAALNSWREETIDRISSGKTGASVRAVQISPTEGGFMVWGNNTIADTAIEQAGGTNVASDIMAIGTASLEQIAAWDPEVIFVFGYSQAKRDAVLANPVLQATSAGRSGRVYILPIGSGAWGSTGEDDPLFFSFVAALLYPETQSHDLVAELQEWFTFMYGRKLSDTELSKVLNLDQNGIAPHLSAIGLDG